MPTQGSQAGGAVPGDRSLIAHLFRRAGFGARPAEIDYYATMTGDGYLAAVNDLLSGVPIAGATPSFEETYDPAERLVGNLRGRAAIQPSLNEIQNTWVKRMVTTTAPLVERMTLFLHDHFATGYRPGATVDTPELETQNRLFRDNAFGNFKTLCHAMLEDVALSCWLNNNVNVKEHPNENLARELFELFTLGVGNYTEQDVRESARALTGYRFAYNLQGTDLVNEATGPRYVMLFDPANHDDGVKTILGRTGNFMPHDVIDIALEQPVAPRFIARKLVETFVVPDAPAGYIDLVASQLIATNWELAPTLRFIFTSPEFKDPGIRYGLVKSPVEFVIGALRALNKKSGDDYAIGLQWMIQAGQAIYDPPNVGGWPSNMGWLGAAGVLARYNAGVQLADRHVNSGGLGEKLRATTPQGWGEIFGVPDLSAATLNAMNGYIADAVNAAATDANAGSEPVVDAAMITLLVASPEFILS
jgi:uncharacterized protein (DUF1800 family)